MANKHKESDRLRNERIAGTSNGTTLRTRIVRDRTRYTRKLKHKKSIAEAMDFAFYLLYLCHGKTKDEKKVTTEEIRLCLSGNSQHAGQAYRLETQVRR